MSEYEKDAVSFRVVKKITKTWQLVHIAIEKGLYT
jgi:hypothetical protein